MTFKTHLHGYNVNLWASCSSFSKGLFSVWCFTTVSVCVCVLLCVRMTLNPLLRTLLNLVIHPWNSVHFRLWTHKRFFIHKKSLPPPPSVHYTQSLWSLWALTEEVCVCSSRACTTMQSWKPVKDRISSHYPGVPMAWSRDTSGVAAHPLFWAGE